MERSEIKNFQDACVWLQDHGVVNVNAVPTPLKDLPEWAEALAIVEMRETTYFEPQFGVQTGTPDEMIYAVERELPLIVVGLYGR